jgi:hypothetical protein
MENVPVRHLGGMVMFKPNEGKESKLKSKQIEIESSYSDAGFVSRWCLAHSDRALARG